MIEIIVIGVLVCLGAISIILCVHDPYDYEWDWKLGCSRQIKYRGGRRKR